MEANNEPLVQRNTLCKKERLCSLKAIEALFGGGNPSFSAFPIRVVFMCQEETGNRILVSVPKRHFKRAVKRNRVKRQIREAYRRHKHILDARQGGLSIAFLWLSDKLYPSDVIESKVVHLLTRILEYDS